MSCYREGSWPRAAPLQGAEPPGQAAACPASPGRGGSEAGGGRVRYPGTAECALRTPRGVPQVRQFSPVFPGNLKAELEPSEQGWHLGIQGQQCLG